MRVAHGRSATRAPVARKQVSSPPSVAPGAAHRVHGLRGVFRQDVPVLTKNARRPAARPAGLIREARRNQEPRQIKIKSCGRGRYVASEVGWVLHKLSPSLFDSGIGWHMHERIIEVLRSCKSRRDLPRAVSGLGAFSPSDLFEVLFPLSVQEQAVDKPVSFSAFALNELNPPCPLSLDVAVEALLPDWDISIEEVVFYLARQFGADAVCSKAVELAERHTGGTSPIVLRAVAYWASIYAAENAEAQ
jgi:hypothetical protein